MALAWGVVQRFVRRRRNVDRMVAIHLDTTVALFAVRVVVFGVPHIGYSDSAGPVSIPIVFLTSPIKW